MQQLELLSQIAGAVLALDPEETAQTVRAALAVGAQPAEVIDSGLAPGMEAVGEQYRAQAMFLPELLMAEQCLRRGLETMETDLGTQDAPILRDAYRGLAQRAAAWMPVLSSCVTRLLHSSDTFLTVKL